MVGTSSARNKLSVLRTAMTKFGSKAEASAVQDLHRGNRKRSGIIITRTTAILPEAVRVLARGRAQGIFPGPVNVAFLALELVSPSRSVPVDSLSRNSEGDSLSRNSEGGSQDIISCTPFPCIPDAQGVLLVMTKIEGLPKNVL